MEGEKVPDLFKCPICLDILSSPFTAVCGHTCCQRCWLKLDGDKQKMDIITGKISSLFIHCPVCRTQTLAGPNHNLRNHIAEKYGKELTNTYYDLVVEHIKEELRDQIRKEESEKLTRQVREMQEGFNDTMQLLERQSRIMPSEPSIVRQRRSPIISERTTEWLTKWFWKLVGFNGVIAIIIAPFLLAVWTYNALSGR